MKGVFAFHASPLFCAYIEARLPRTLHSVNFLQDLSEVRQNYLMLR
jgi:hypothetical protein